MGPLRRHRPRTFEQSNLGSGADAVACDGRYVAVGEPLDDTPRPVAWSSYDGVYWTVVDLPPLPEGWVLGGGIDTVASSESTLLITGEFRTPAGHESQDSGAAVYASSDGAGWKLTAIEDHRFGPVVGAPTGFVARAESLDSNSPVSIAHSADGLIWDYDEVGIVLSGAALTDEAGYLIGRDTAAGSRALWRLGLL